MGDTESVVAIIEQTTNVHLHDRVELVRPVEGFAAGTSGIIIDAYPAHDVYTLEVVDENGFLLTLLPCSAADLRITA
jgi:hypothetical protein